MQPRRFSNLSIAIQMLASAFRSSTSVGGVQNEIALNKAIRAAQRRHDRFYGCTSKYKPHVSFGKAQRRYAARIAAGKIPEAEILRAA